MKILFLVTILLLPTSSLSQDEDIKRIYRTHEFHSSLKAKTYSSQQSDSIFTTLGRWAWGWCQAIAVQGSHAYLGNGETFQVFDVTNPAKPILDGVIITDGVIEDIQLKGSYAFVGCWAGLKIIDISNSMSPGIIYSSPPGMEYIYRIELLDTIALICSGTCVYSVDIKDFAHPYTLDTYPMRVEYITVKGHYLYATSRQTNLITIIDISNPSSLTYIDNISIYPDDWITDIKVVDNFLYVCTDFPQHLQIYDLTTPQNPPRVNILGYRVHGRINSDSSYIYMTVIDSGAICIFDKSNPTNPPIVGKVEKADFWGWYAVPSGGFLYIAAFHSFQTADIRDLHSTKLLYNYPTAGAAHKIRLQGNLAYIATFLNGMWILDVTNPTSPRPLANVDLGEYSTNIMVDGYLAYVIDNYYAPSPGLWIIDISDPYHPEVLSYHVGIVRSGGGFPFPSIAKWGNFLFLTQPGSTQDDSTLEIIDVSNPSSPVTSSVFHSTYEPWDVAVKDSIIYLATKYGGLRLINFSNPSMPYEVTSMFDRTYRLKRDGDYLYVAASDSIYILDISQPVTPLITGSAYPGFYEYADMAVSGKFLYCTYLGGLYVFDVANPKKTMLKGIFNVEISDEHNESSVTTGENLVILSNPDRGVWLLQNKLDTANLPRFQVSQGWNLLSVPTGSIDNKRFIGDAIVATGAISPAYKYSGSGYEIADTIVDGNGFWMKFDSSRDVHFIGSPIPTTTIDVYKGWNIIGSIKNPLSAALITTQPPGIITSNYYEYDAQYLKSDTIYPSKGYWVKVSQTGRLALLVPPSPLSISENKSHNNSSAILLETLDRIELRNPDGHCQMLYFGSDIGPDLVRKYELPPPIPFGSFDARFYSGSMLEVINPNDSIYHQVLYSSAKYPLTISWVVRSSNMQYVLSIDGKKVALSACGTVQILDANSRVNIRAQSIHSIPKDFKLEQNYPNPFNGNTVIKYGVPQPRSSLSGKPNVIIKVFNTLGQEVAVLVSGETLPGNYAITWNPSSHPTGVYYYRLEAEGISLVKHMAYIK